MPHALLLLLSLSLLGPSPVRRVQPAIPDEPASHGCGRSVGFVGRPILELEPFIDISGFSTSTALSASATLRLVGDDPDVIFVTRSGADFARTNAAALNSWIRGGGLLVTEFTATQILYEPGPLGYLSGALVDDFWVPSGTACGGNAIRVEVPGRAIAEGLPDIWPCSGDPMGTLQVFSGIDPRLCVVLSVVGSDRDGDGRDDPVLGVTPVGSGAVAAFFSDFGNFQPLEDPHLCPSGPLSAPCRRSPLDEQVLLNVLCHGDEPIDCSAACGDCEALRQTLAELPTDDEGLRRSLDAKARAACASLDDGRTIPAAQQLCALLREAGAQAGRKLALGDAEQLRACVESLADAEGLSLGVGLGTCRGRPLLGLP